MLRTEYLSEKLTPYPLPTKDGGVLRTVDDARAYMLMLPKERKLCAHWQHASRLLLEEARAAALTQQVQVALFMDGKLDDGAFRHTSPRSVSTSAVKKSVPASSARWIRMKAGQVVVRLRSGAGGKAWRCKTLPTV